MCGACLSHDPHLVVDVGIILDVIGEKVGLRTDQQSISLRGLFKPPGSKGRHLRKRKLCFEFGALMDRRAVWMCDY